ncbi:MAG: hypothetical protein LH614_15195 [Pyrinomonadaceae bacterium]|nr:hypothetical protein [Pyrinomonadaceae bacterium]
MNTLETIQQKVFQLPPKAQEEVLEIVEQIAERYQIKESVHPLTLIRELAVDVGVTDLAERHDFYAHGKLED